MTGIERLRELANKYAEAGKSHVTIDVVAGGMATLFTSIADQIEREITPQERHDELADGHADDVSMSAYDLLPADEREAIAWVRGHGGLDAVRAERRSRVPRDRYELMRQRLLDHIAECETALGSRRRRVEELGQRVQSLTAKNAELRKRAMPEGMEWPRFEGGELVRVGDKFAEHGGCENVADSVEIGDCWFKIHGFDGAAPRYSRRASVKRPAPKVLDADGAEIRVGDTVYLLPGKWCNKWPLYRCHEWDEIEVLNLSPNHDSGRIECKTLAKAVMCYPQPSQLTHRAPVLAADGKPLREGETVWGTKGNGPYSIEKIETDGVVRISGTDLDYFGNDFVHECPDSWERLEEDATMPPWDYCEGHGLFEADSAYKDLPTNERFARDLVRRAKALAGDA